MFLATRRTLVFVAAAAFTAAAQPQAPDPRTREQLFERAFGRPAPPIPVSGYVLVALDGESAQKLRAAFGPGEGEVRMDGAHLLELLGERLRTEALERLRQGVDAEGWISRATLAANGIESAFDPRRFQVTLASPPELRSRSVRHLSGAPPSSAGALRPATVSAFLNLNAKAASRRQGTGLTSSRSDVAFAADGAVRAGGLVLEGSGSGVTGDGRGLQRGDVRLLRDWPDEALRLAAGDLRYPVVGFQTTVQMGGIGLSRDFSLQPYRRSYQASRFEFYLERPAVVQVWVNASLVSTLQLPAGLHDIRGLSPVAGLNSTRLVIEDAAGRIQTLEFDFIYSPLLLAQGADLFSFNAGLRRRMVDSRYAYDTDQPVLSGAYLRGLSGSTTGGVYLQADAERAVLGLQGTLGLPRGSVQLDVAARRTEGAPAGGGLRLTWIHTGSPGSAWGLQGQAGVEYLGPHFGNINDFLPARHGRVNFFGTLGLPLDAHGSLQLAAYRSAARERGRPASHNVSLAWNRRLGPATLTVGLRHRRTESGLDDKGLFVGLVYAFTDPGYTFQAVKETERDVGSVHWTTTRTNMASNAYAFANARAGSGIREFDVGAGYWTHQGLVEAAHARSQIEQGTRRFVREEASLRGQTAIVFADGAVGLTPVVMENFAIVRGKHGLADVPLRVDPDGQGGGRAQSAWISPAVVSDLGSYLLRDIRIEPVDPPFGATPDRLSYLLAPAYKSGMLVELGKEAPILAVGRLVDPRGQPLEHVGLEVRRMGDGPREPLRTFSGRNGAFQLVAPRPGRYEITPSGPAAWNTLIVDIEATPDGLFRLGNLAVTR